MKQLQATEKMSPRTFRFKGNMASSRRLGTFSERNDLDHKIEAMEETLGLANNNLGAVSGEKRLAAQVNAVAVLDMIKNLQDEIQVSNLKNSISND